MNLSAIARFAVLAAEFAGIAVIVLGSLVLCWHFARALRQGESIGRAYHLLRRNLGRVILLGLEFLVAADIMRTVTTRPSFAELGVLGALVLIRTFLSFALEIEINGKLPWRMDNEAERL